VKHCYSTTITHDISFGQWINHAFELRQTGGDGQWLEKY